MIILRWKRYSLNVLLGFVTPGILLALAISSWFWRLPLAYGDYVYPDSIQAFGWIIEMTSPVLIVLYPFYTLLRLRLKGGVAWSDMGPALFKPTQSWYDADRTQVKEEDESSAASSSSSSSDDGVEETS